MNLSALPEERRKPIPTRELLMDVLQVTLDILDRPSGSSMLADERPERTHLRRGSSLRECGWDRSVGESEGLHPSSRSLPCSQTRSRSLDDFCVSCHSDCSSSHGPIATPPTCCRQLRQPVDRRRSRGPSRTLTNGSLRRKVLTNHNFEEEIGAWRDLVCRSRDHLSQHSLLMPCNKGYKVPLEKKVSPSAEQTNSCGDLAEKYCLTSLNQTVNLPTESSHFKSLSLPRLQDNCTDAALDSDDLRAQSSTCILRPAIPYIPPPPPDNPPNSLDGSVKDLSSFSNSSLGPSSDDHPESIGLLERSMGRTGSSVSRSLDTLDGSLGDDEAEVTCDPIRRGSESLPSLVFDWESLTSRAKIMGLGSTYVPYADKFRGAWPADERKSRRESTQQSSVADDSKPNPKEFHFNRKGNQMALDITQESQGAHESYSDDAHDETVADFAKCSITAQERCYAQEDNGFMQDTEWDTSQDIMSRKVCYNTLEVKPENNHSSQCDPSLQKESSARASSSPSPLRIVAVSHKKCPAVLAAKSPTLSPFKKGNGNGCPHLATDSKETLENINVNEDRVNSCIHEEYGYNPVGDIDIGIIDLIPKGMKLFSKGVAEALKVRVENEDAKQLLPFTKQSHVWMQASQEPQSMYSALVKPPEGPTNPVSYSDMYGASSIDTEVDQLSPSSSSTDVDEESDDGDREMSSEESSSSFEDRHVNQFVERHRIYPLPAHMKHDMNKLPKLRKHLSLSPQAKRRNLYSDSMKKFSVSSNYSGNIHDHTNTSQPWAVPKESTVGDDCYVCPKGAAGTDRKIELHKIWDSTDEQDRIIRASPKSSRLGIGQRPLGISRNEDNDIVNENDCDMWKFCDSVDKAKMHGFYNLSLHSYGDVDLKPPDHDEEHNQSKNKIIVQTSNLSRMDGNVCCDKKCIHCFHDQEDKAPLAAVEEDASLGNIGDCFTVNEKEEAIDHRALLSADKIAIDDNYGSSTVMLEKILADLETFRKTLCQLESAVTSDSISPVDYHRPMTAAMHYCTEQQALNTPQLCHSSKQSYRCDKKAIMCQPRSSLPGREPLKAEQPNIIHTQQPQECLLQNFQNIHNKEFSSEATTYEGISSGREKTCTWFCGHSQKDFPQFIAGPQSTYIGPSLDQQAPLPSSGCRNTYSQYSQTPSFPCPCMVLSHVPKVHQKLIQPANDEERSSWSISVEQAFLKVIQGMEEKEDSELRLIVDYYEVMEHWCKETDFQFDPDQCEAQNSDQLSIERCRHSPFKCRKNTSAEVENMKGDCEEFPLKELPGYMLSMMDSSTCLALALEGERLCKTEDCRAGVAFFEAALQTGTDDLRTLSAIYSQLGNAYFYLGEYNKAMEYHKLDLTVARTMGDRLGVAKASGNLGNTLKVMGRFSEAIICCERHLSISQELGDKVGEGRALYNLGNVYHAYGKHTGRAGPQEPGEVSEEVKHWLTKAVEYYAANLSLVQELNDRSAQGRACGNLGNTHYLLGNFTQAVSYHHERLLIAKEFGDRAAERRALSNLGNAHIFLGDFENAADLYSKTLQLAQELSDRAVEAQACYSLGNTHTLLRDYPTAIEYHLLHLSIAQELGDKIGESRACWSLGNAYSAIDNHEKALSYANRHLEISVEIGDKTGQAAAQMHLADLRRILGLPPTSEAPNESEEKARLRRRSMENMDLLKMTPDNKGVLRKQSEDAGIGSLSSNDSHTPYNGGAYGLHTDKNTSLNEESGMDDDSFFELLSRFQSKRMDDQRCTLTVEPSKENNSNSSNKKSSNIEEVESSSTAPDSSNSTVTSSETPATGNGVQELMEMIAGMQSQRMDEQRASLPQLPGLNNQEALLQRLSYADSTSEPDDSFFDMLMRCQGSRIEDQRSSLPTEVQVTQSAVTVPDDDFFSVIVRFQSGRLEDQRSNFPGEAGNSPNPSDSNTSSATSITKDKPRNRLAKARK